MSSDYYRARIQKALAYIEAHLNERFSAADVARAAHFSEFHFHRLFAAYTGESVHKYVLSRRMERAAHLLVTQPSARLMDVALGVGYETHSAFSRAFRSHFGLAPGAFRLAAKPMGKDRSRPFLHTAGAQTLCLDVAIRECDALKFVYRVARGTNAGQFFGVSPPSDSLRQLLVAAAAHLRGIASGFPASPQSLNDESADVWYGGLIDPSAHVDWSEREHFMGAGTWAVHLHVGAYAFLHQSWNQVYRAWLPDSSWSLRDELPFEKYLNDPAHVAPSELRTEIWVPIQKSRI